MHDPVLTADEVDDLLYFARANEAQDLEQAVTQFAQKYQCQPGEVLAACVDSETGNTTLHYCSANGLTDLLQKLLTLLSNGEVQQAENGNQLNAQNKLGNTPLHWAAYNGHLPAVKALITAGADMWVKNAAGHLAMFEAERADKSEVVQYLLEAGGREVEKTGTEGQASADDEVDIKAGDVVPADGAAVAGASQDVNMSDDGPTG